jgi:hypothetical protein
MKKSIFLFVFCLIFCNQMITAHAVDASVQQPPTENPAVHTQNQSTIDTESYTTGRGSYRSPRGSFTGGNRGGINNPGFRSGPNAPSSGVTNPGRPNAGQSRNPLGRWGSFFGGAALGVMLGHLLNPFAGFGNGGSGFSFIALIFWAVILYAAFKLFQRYRRRQR